MQDGNPLSFVLVLKERQEDYRPLNLRAQRIGVDLDSRNRLRMLMAYFNGRLIGPTEVYRTGRGFHLKIRLELPCLARMNVRAWLGDDPEVLWWDFKRHERGLHSWENTQFQFKQYRSGRWTREELIDPLAEPFWQPRVARKF